MHSDPLAKRRRLVKVRNRIESALKKRFKDDKENRDKWALRLKRVDACIRAKKSTDRISEEIAWLKVLLQDEQVFTAETILSFGNGHSKNCSCGKCTLIPQRKFGTHFAENLEYSLISADS